MKSLKNIIISILHRKTPKNKSNVILKTPIYQDRHKDQNILILATGPSLKTHINAINAFIKKYSPVVIGCNYTGDSFKTDYQGFANRKRFCKHIKNYTKKDCKLLLSPYFADHILQAKDVKVYEEISFKGKDSLENGVITITDGIIYSEGGTIATLMIAVAIVMGAKNIYIAGMDGYSKSTYTHHYNESDDKNYEDLLKQEKLMNQQLLSLEKYLIGKSGGEITIITPTAYEKYHKPIGELLNCEK